MPGSVVFALAFPLWLLAAWWIGRQQPLAPGQQDHQKAHYDTRECQRKRQQRNQRRAPEELLSGEEYAADAADH